MSCEVLLACDDNFVSFQGRCKKFYSTGPNAKQNTFNKISPKIGQTNKFENR